MLPSLHILMTLLATLALAGCGGDRLFLAQQSGRVRILAAGILYRIDQRSSWARIGR